jgi:hypothetical protein
LLKYGGADELDAAGMSNVFLLSYFSFAWPMGVGVAPALRVVDDLQHHFLVTLAFIPADVKALEVYVGVAPALRVIDLQHYCIVVLAVRLIIGRAEIEY